MTGPTRNAAASIPGAVPAEVGPPSGAEGRLSSTLTAVSSTTKLVWSEESSFIRNFTVTVLPL